MTRALSQYIEAPKAATEAEVESGGDDAAGELACLADGFVRSVHVEDRGADDARVIRFLEQEFQESMREDLSQNRTSLAYGNVFTPARNKLLRRLALAITLPFVGVVAAFGIAPGTVTEKVELKRVVEDVALPALAALGAQEETYWHEERIQRTDTVAGLLTRLGVEDAGAVRFLRTSSEAKGLRQLIPGRVMRATTGEDGRLVELRYPLGLTTLTVRPDGEGFRVREEVTPLERRVVMKSGEIKSSLFSATDAAQLTDAIADQLSQVFSTDIDFHKDIRRGDRFTVVYEMYYESGEPVRSGRMLAAEFVNQGKPYQAVWFDRGNGQGDYYTPEGKPIKKAFLRSPLEFSRISSGFTMARFHPILQRWRAHTGVDYSAPTGTGVKATSDGVVEFAGQKSGYGNVVILRHQKRYTTLYGHLSGFGRGVHVGAQVSQGEIIGFVGMTGLATGPHLHYEFRIDDVYQDPLTVAMPDAAPITMEYRSAFEAIAQPMRTRLALLRNANLASLQ